MVKVSVIVPVYNSSKYLRKCLDSLKKQTIDDIEFIIVNDCSIDNSLDIINEYLDDPRFILINNIKNGGTGYSRNKGISRSRGEYIGFVDSDDYVSKTMYETMYKCATNNDCDVVVSNISFVNDDNGYNESLASQYSESGYLVDMKNDPDTIFFQSPSVCNKLFRRELVNKSSFLEGVMFEDIAFSYNMLMMSNKTYYMSNHDYYYRKGYEGISSTVYKPNYHINDIFDVCDDIGRCAIRHGYFDKYYDQIKFLQISSSLIRLREIIDWDLDDSSKNKIIVRFLNAIDKRFGDYHDLDKGLLSMKFSVLDMDYVDNIRKMREKRKNTL